MTNKTAEFTLMVLRPPRQIRKSAQTRLIKCKYPTKEGVANKSFKVGDLRTVTDLPSTIFSDEDPTHELTIVDLDNKRVDKAEPGDPLIGKLRVSPKSYVASIKNCYLAPDREENSEKYQIIDEKGCPADPDVGGWHWNLTTHSVQLPFKAFRLLDWNENHIFCEVHYCIKKSDCAPPSDCPNIPKPCRGPKP
ncbi:GSCOCG00009132001-RA-CDS [Cotesia congregata]|nr:GSCOCG00009132001-RA-CDS [Cotesia congregata]